MGFRILVLVVVSLSSMPMSSQSKPAVSPSYVASVRPASGAPGGFWITPGLFRASNVTARFLIAIGYGLQPWQITGGPGWLDTERFDVDARLESEPADKGLEGPMIKALARKTGFVWCCMRIRAMLPSMRLRWEPTGRTGSS